ncbi:unnamed protein product [Gemmata massiliana]|uniref:Uncharacterized protein n=1 Tax=Gemmata massiliana TaxID=1210884 RepID=A0A6P2CYL6_9BACT|nr:hypothetical protein [Gemmata massiliana]VTR92884.1 unnamed protein product [Gemmata massiliana]
MSCETFVLLVIGVLCFSVWSVIETTKDIANAAGKILDNETVQEVSRGVLISWFDSWFSND